MTGNPYRTADDEPENPTKTAGATPPNDKNWQETGRLPTGMRVGRKGGLWYVLDEDGWAISEGYHEISDDGRHGKRGAREESIDLRGEPDWR